MEATDYKVVNGTYFYKDTPDEVCRCLSHYMHDRNTRIRLFYGDANTGQDWLESYDIMGYIGRSCGSIKIPLMINNRRSFSGPGILDRCIVKITVDKRVIYQHPTYNCNIKIDGCNVVDSEGKQHVCCQTPEAAKKWYMFLKGERNTH